MSDLPSPGKRGRTTTVHSAKGGSGKTVLATNLAVVLSANEARRVCLVDLDVAFGDVATSLSLMPRRSLVDARTRVGDLDMFAIQSVVTPFAHGLDCILAPVGPGDAEKVSAELVGDLLGELPHWYDHVIVDTPVQLSPHVLAALDSADHHVLVTTPERPALRSLRVVIDMFELLSYERESRSVVVNRCDSDVDIPEQNIERAVKTTIACRIPCSRDVPASLNSGRPLALTNPEHPVSQAIRRFAETVLTANDPRPA